MLLGGVRSHAYSVRTMKFEAALTALSSLNPDATEFHPLTAVQEGEGTGARSGSDFHLHRQMQRPGATMANPSGMPTTPSSTC